jgi:RNA polymerase sigma-70 factor (ECF subfamily)
MASNDSLSHHFRQVGLRQLNKEAARLTKDEIHSIFLKLADTLTAKQRVIFILREVEGRSSGEVAQILGCRESTIRNHLFNARKVLRGELMRLHPEYVPEHLRDAEVKS